MDDHLEKILKSIFTLQSMYVLVQKVYIEFE